MKISEPRMVDLRHSHKLNRIRRGRYEVRDRLYDRYGRRRRYQPDLIAFKFARHHLGAFDDPFDVSRAICAEGDVKCPWLTSAVQPSHDFVAGEQAKLLFQTKIGFREAATNSHDARRKDAFDEDRSDETLHVWCEAEGNSIVGRKYWSLTGDTGEQLTHGNSAGGTGYVESGR